ncbi:MAG: carbon-nitrogen hydrolase family protein [Bacteroidales bacterium]|jgi:predicted amidohydrolase
MYNRIKSILIALCLFISGYCQSQGSIKQRHTKKTRPVKIAIAQIVCLDGDLSGNLVRIENAMAEAKEKQAEIIVFPESCLLGWVNPVAFQRACQIPGKDSKRICDLAKKYAMYICIGLDEKDNDKLYDAAILIDDQGNILLKHRKINVLPTLMDPPYSVGDDVHVASTKFGKIGVMICADSFQEDLLKSMKEKKPGLLLIPYGWAAVENDWPAHGQELVKVVKNATTIINCPVIGTNLVGEISHGPWKGQIYGGQSVGYDPKNGALSIGKDRERDLVVVTVKVTD